MDDDPRARKLLGDLLALTLSENAGQAEAALAALRRRAAREGVSGGAVKQALELLRGVAVSSAPPDEAGRLRGVIAAQRRELEQAQAALGRARAVAAGLSDDADRSYRTRRSAWFTGFVLGLVVAGAAAGAYLASARRAGVGEAGRREVAAAVGTYLHDCYLANSNSLVGTPFRLHVVVDLGADGRVTAARIAADQDGHIDDPDRALYGEMVIRTLRQGSCGAVPRPASWQGRASEIDFYMPR